MMTSMTRVMHNFEVSDIIVEIIFIFMMDYPVGTSLPKTRNLMLALTTRPGGLAVRLNKDSSVNA